MPTKCQYVAIISTGTLLYDLFLLLSAFLAIITRAITPPKTCAACKLAMASKKEYDAFEPAPINLISIDRYCKNPITCITKKASPNMAVNESIERYLFIFRSRKAFTARYIVRLLSKIVIVDTQKITGISNMVQFA